MTPPMQLRLELVPLPVQDVDRAKSFYEQCGFHLDVDHQPSDQFRVVQFTPPGSACSIVFGIGIDDDVPPGSVRGLHLVTTDIEAARADLLGRGIEVGDVQHMSASGWKAGVSPSHEDYASFAHFADPDGNSWALQEVGHPDRPVEKG